MANIFDLVNSKEIGTYYTNNPSNSVPYLGATLFPSKKQLGLDLSWIKGANGLPVALMPSAFDTKATLRDRVGFSKIETEMPFFREAMRIGEKDRQEINKAAGASNSQYIMPIIQKIYDDVNGLVQGAEVNNERMRMQLLSTGKILITANRVNLDYDYKFKAAHKETLLTTARWSDSENSAPVEDIMRWQKVIEDDTGEKPTRAICSLKTWNYLMANKSIKLDLNPIGGQNVIVTDAKGFVARKNKTQNYEDKITYVCATFHRYGSEFCKGHRIFESDIDELILAEIKSLIYNAKLNLDKIDEDIEEKRNNRKDYEKAIEILKFKIENQKEEIKNYSKQLAKGLIDIEIFKELTKEAKIELEKQENLLIDAENSRDNHDSNKEKIINCIEVLQSILDKNELTNADITMLIEKIVITETDEVGKYNMPKLDIEINWNTPFVVL